MLDFFHLSSNLSLTGLSLRNIIVFYVIFFRKYFSTYEEFHVKLSNIERRTYSKYFIVKGHTGFSKRSKREEISYLFEML